MKASLRGVARIVTCAVLLGCGGGASASGIGGYFRDRAYDLLDMFRFRVSMAHSARAAGIHVRATALAQVGLLYFDGDAVGIDRRGVGRWDERRLEGGLGPCYWTGVWRERASGNHFLNADDAWSRVAERGLARRERIHWDDGRRHPLSIGVELQTGLLPGFDIGLYPEELFDFVFGIVTLDLMQDDLRTTQGAYAFYEALPPQRDWPAPPEAEEEPAPRTVDPGAQSAPPLPSADTPPPPPVEPAPETDWAPPPPPPAEPAPEVEIVPPVPLPPSGEIEREPAPPESTPPPAPPDRDEPAGSAKDND